MEKHSEKQTNKNKKIVIALVVVVAVIIAVGIIAAVTGVFSSSPKSAGKNISRAEALESNEYKAVKDYNAYLSGLTDEERDKVVDSSDEAIYDVPTKVKELCETYKLKYASKVTAMQTYEEAEKALADIKAESLLGKEMTEALKDTFEEYESGSSYDDGNLELELEQTNESDRSVAVSITLGISPEGTFPQMSYSLEPDSEEDMEPGEQKASTFVLSPKSGGEFACMTDASDGVAFGKTGKYFVTMAVSKQLTDEESDNYDKAREELDKKIKKEANIGSFEELEEKVNAGLETAWEKEPDAMQKAQDSNDKEQWEALKLKYTKASKAEIALYDACSKELKKYDEKEAVSQEDMQSYLDQLDFSVFM